jgi:hypothetical protein
MIIVVIIIIIIIIIACSLIDRVHLAHLSIDRPTLGDAKASRLNGLLAQRHVTLLGRSIDLNLAISRRVEQMCVADLDVVIAMYESNTICGVKQLNIQLDVIEETHRHLGTTYCNVMYYKSDI